MGWSAFAQTLTPGKVIPSVACQGDAAQSYALYLPPGYTAERKWPVIFGFDPRARGLTPVERFEVAAAKYGYIVAGSNNSRNGSWEVSMAAVRAMTSDVSQRFAIDPKRVYAVGMSGGARVAMGIGLGSGEIAGVIAASAGFPDSKPRKAVSFAVFETAGTEDFNYMEMRQVDRALTSPHHLAVFEGGHTWPSSELAMEAVEWLEVQAMRSGRKAKDEALVEALFTRRMAGVEALEPYAQWLRLEGVATDFASLKPVDAIASRAAGMRKQKAVKEGLKKDKDELDKEERLMARVMESQRGLFEGEKRAESLRDLKEHFEQLARQAKAEADSSDRRVARRVGRGLLAGSFERGAKDPEYTKLMEGLRQALGNPRTGMAR